MSEKESGFSCPTEREELINWAEYWQTISALLLFQLIGASSEEYVVSHQSALNFHVNDKPRVLAILLDGDIRLRLLSDAEYSQLVHNSSGSILDHDFLIEENNDAGGNGVH